LEFILGFGVRVGLKVVICVGLVGEGLD